MFFAKMLPHTHTHTHTQRSKSSDSEMSMSRREKLLRQELDVIDKAIAKKKYKKRSY